MELVDVPITALCQAHSWAWASIRYSRLRRKGSESSWVGMSPFRDSISGGSAEEIR